MKNKLNNKIKLLVKEAMAISSCTIADFNQGNKKQLEKSLGNLLAIVSIMIDNGDLDEASIKDAAELKMKEFKGKK